MHQRWGHKNLARSRSYIGSGQNLQPFLDKVRAGRPVSIGVLGGSISACAEVTTEECYPFILADRLSKIPGLSTDVSLHNGAMGGMRSIFYLRCWPVIMPPDMDLIIIEFSANDPAEVLVNREMALLLKSLLSQPSRPSILILDFYSPLLHWYSAGVGINTLGEFFDIPVIRQVLACRSQDPLRPLIWSGLSATETSCIIIDTAGRAQLISPIGGPPTMGTLRTDIILLRKAMT